MVSWSNKHCPILFGDYRRSVGVRNECKMQFSCLNAKRSGVNKSASPAFDVYV